MSSVFLGSSPLEIIIVVDDHPNVGSMNWQASMSMISKLMDGYSSFITSGSWRMAIITYGGTTIYSLVDQQDVNVIKDRLRNAQYPRSSADGGRNVVQTMMTNTGRSGTASIIMLMPSLHRSFDVNVYT